MIAQSRPPTNGAVVGATLVTESISDEIMLIDRRRAGPHPAVPEIREMGRATGRHADQSGDEGTQLAGLEKMIEGDTRKTHD